MSEEQAPYIEPPAALPQRPRLRHFDGDQTPFKRMIDQIPPKAEEAPHDADAEIAAAATTAANHRSEARRDAVLAVALAIARRGQNPVSDWTTRDTDTAYVIADQLIALG
jgi:hypothetical protein